MVYETFLETVTDALKARLGSNFTVIIHPVPKNNGLSADGLCIGKESEAANFTIYLTPYYLAYQEGLSMDDILDDLCMLYEQSTRMPHSDPNQMTKLCQVKDQIVYQVINGPANEELLKDVPHISYPQLELELVFYLLLEDGQVGSMTALIHNCQQELWEISTEELWQIARANTPRLLPEKLKSMEDMMKDMMRESMGSQYDDEIIRGLLKRRSSNGPLYLLSNTSELYGACCIFYEGVLKNFADRLDSDLIILPSSIHEVLLAPYNNKLSYEALNKTILSINQNEVLIEDQLSNHLFFYSRKEDCLSIASHSLLSIGTTNPS